MGSFLISVHRFIQATFWAIGYYVGFSIVTLLSGGWFVAEEFRAIQSNRSAPWRMWTLKYDRLHLAAEIVSTVGWVGILATTAFLLYLTHREAIEWLLHTW